ncbi:MAG: GNAT family N-acetyltransferase [Bacteroides sp.]|nr:GNAT family N-acetyltransferase [Bacteroides sp.]MCM1378511.1 GNAT family N-acetyltransferase [Bacteroides sp.]MCM1444812.1 GNAT family N-acetyltransferase [Prevotella sp.]
MMSKKSDIMKIWSECFPDDSPRWRRMFFDAVYVDDEALTIYDADSEQTVSSLLLLSYAMTFQGSTVGLGYIYGAGTLKRFRARGYMSQLMGQALREASERGDTFVALIPATEALRRYYSRFDFSTTFFTRPERYTAAHVFPFERSYEEVYADNPRLYDAFQRLMAARPCCVQHSRAQFLTLMDDARLSGYGFAAVGNPFSGEPLAMLWAEPEVASSTLRVRELLSVDADAANAALSALKRQFPDSPITLMRQPSDYITSGNFIPGGMARVVNAENALRAVARNNPDTTLIVKVTDSMLPENNGYYILAGGTLTISDDLPAEAVVNLDLTPEVLTAMLFSSVPIAEITGLPARRPRMTLMLD